MCTTADTPHPVDPPRQHDTPTARTKNMQKNAVSTASRKHARYTRERRTRNRFAQAHRQFVCYEYRLSITHICQQSISLHTFKHAYGRMVALVCSERFRRTEQVLQARMVVLRRYGTHKHGYSYAILSVSGVELCVGVKPRYLQCPNAQK